MADPELDINPLDTYHSYNSKGFRKLGFAACLLVGAGLTSGSGVAMENPFVIVLGLATGVGSIFVGLEASAQMDLANATEKKMLADLAQELSTGDFAS